MNLRLRVRIPCIEWMGCGRRQQLRLTDQPVRKAVTQFRNSRVSLVRMNEPKNTSKHFGYDFRKLHCRSTRASRLRKLTLLALILAALPYRHQCATLGACCRQHPMRPQMDAGVEEALPASAASPSPQPLVRAIRDPPGSRSQSATPDAADSIAGALSTPLLRLRALHLRCTARSSATSMRRVNRRRHPAATATLRIRGWPGSKLRLLGPGPLRIPSDIWFDLVWNLELSRS